MKKNAAACNRCFKPLKEGQSFVAVVGPYIKGSATSRGGNILLPRHHNLNVFCWLRKLK